MKLSKLILRFCSAAVSLSFSLTQVIPPISFQPASYRDSVHSMLAPATGVPAEARPFDKLAAAGREFVEAVGELSAEGDDENLKPVTINAGKKFDRATLKLNGGEPLSRIYLSKPRITQSGERKFAVRDFGSSAVRQLQDLLGRGARQGDTTKYLLLSELTATGESRFAIVEERVDGRRILWTDSKGTPGVAETDRLGALLAFLYPIPSVTPRPSLPSWREAGFSQKATTHAYPKGQWGSQRAQVDGKLCEGCDICAAECPDMSLSPFIGNDMDFCSGCTKCEQVCPVGAIAMVEKRTLEPTVVKKLEEKKLPRLEFEGDLVGDLARFLLKDDKPPTLLGGFTIQRLLKEGLAGKDILQVDLGLPQLADGAAQEETPLTLTLIRENGRWTKAVLMRQRNLLIYGLGKIELAMASALQREGYRIVAAVEREEIPDIGFSVQALDTEKEKFVQAGLYSSSSIWALLDRGGIDAVFTGETAYLTAPQKRAIQSKTFWEMGPLEPKPFDQTRDPYLNAILRRVYQESTVVYPKLRRQGAGANLFETIAKDHFGVAPGHRLCPACPQPTIVKTVLQLASELAQKEGRDLKPIVSINTGCMTASGMSSQHGTMWEIPAIRAGFGNAVAVASGVAAAIEYLERKEKTNPKDKYTVFVFSGDGGTADIGFQALSGAAERGHRIIYVTFDNEAYMNTGGQQSSATSVGASTKTTPAGSVIPGKVRTRKDVPAVMRAHENVYVAETSPDPENMAHFVASIEGALRHDGFSYIHVNSTCHTGQGFTEENVAEISSARVKAGLFPLTISTQGRTSLVLPKDREKPASDASLLAWLAQREIFADFFEKGKPKSEYQILEYCANLIPLVDSMKLEGRFGHLFKKEKKVVKRGYGEEVSTEVVTEKEEARPIIHIAQIDVMVRWLGLLAESRPELYPRVAALKPLLLEKKKLENEKLKELAQKTKAAIQEKAEQAKKAGEEAPPIQMDQNKRRQNQARLGDKELKIKWYGYAGQGQQTGSKTLALLSQFLGLYPMSWPSFGPERSGAPVEASNKLSGAPILDRSEITDADLAIVLASQQLDIKDLRSRILSNLKKDGVLIINTPLSPEEARTRFKLADYKIYTVDLSKIAKTHLGDADRVSVATLAPILKVLCDLGLDFNWEKARELIAQDTATLLKGKQHLVKKNMEAFEAANRGTQSGAKMSQLVGIPVENLEHLLPDGEVMTGNEAVVAAAMQIKLDLFGGYPITPSTTIGELLAFYKAVGLFDGELVLTESEKSAIGVLMGAAAMGIEAWTATASQGLLWMTEELYAAAGMGLPIVIYDTSRSLSRKDLSIFADHSDTMSQMDAGWIQLFASNVQEVYDMMLMASLITRQTRIPVQVMVDGFEVSHKRELFQQLDEKTIEDFRAKWMKQIEKWEEAGTYGVGSSPASNMEGQVAQARRMEAAPEFIKKIFKDFGRVSGRQYSSVDTFGAEDAESAVVVLGSSSSMAKVAARKLASEDVPVRVVSPRVFLPFPSKEIQEALAGTQVVGVLDRSIIPGATASHLAREVTVALSQMPRKRNKLIPEVPPLIFNEVYGLGGRQLSPNDAERIFKKARLLLESSGEVSEKDLKFVEDILAEAWLQVLIRKSPTEEFVLEEGIKVLEEKINKFSREDQELAADVAMLVLEIAQIHVDDLELEGRTSFDSDEEKEAAQTKYMEELIKALANLDTLQILGFKTHYGVREGVVDERTKREALIELIEMARAKKILAEDGNGVKPAEKVRAARLVFDFTGDNETRQMAIQVLKQVIGDGQQHTDPVATRLAQELLKRFKEPTPIKVSLTNVVPENRLETIALKEVLGSDIPPKFAQNFEHRVERYLSTREVHYVPRLLGIEPGDPAYEKLKDLIIELGKEDFDLAQVVAVREVGADGTAAHTPGFATCVTAEGKIGIEAEYLKGLIDAGNSKALLAVIYHERIEAALVAAVEEAGFVARFTRSDLHKIAQRLEGNNFGISPLSPEITDAALGAIVSEVNHHGLPSALIQEIDYLKVYLQKKALEEMRKNGGMTLDKFEALAKEVFSRPSRNGIQMPTRQILEGYLNELVEFRNRLDAVQVEKGQISDLARFKNGATHYFLVTETVLIDRANGIWKRYLGEESVEAMKGILQDLKDTAAVKALEQGGRLALLTQDGYPYALGIVWEGQGGDSLLWTNGPSPFNVAAYEDWHRRILAAMNGVALGTALPGYTRWGYERYATAGIMDDNQSSRQSRTSTWAKETAAIDWAKCVDCLHCVMHCPEGAIKVTEGGVMGIDVDQCKGCELCKVACDNAGHDAVALVTKDKLRGASLLDKRPGRSVELEGTLAEDLVSFLMSQIKDKKTALVGDQVVRELRRGYSLDGDEILQIEMADRYSDSAKKPMLYTFLTHKIGKEVKFSMIARPKETVLVYGTGVVEAMLASKLEERGFHVVAVSRFPNDSISVDETVDSKRGAFKTAELLVEDALYLERFRLQVELEKTSLQNEPFKVTLLQKKIQEIDELLKEKGLDPQIDYCVTGQSQLVDPAVGRAFFAMTGLPVVSPGGLFVTHHHEIDDILEKVWAEIPEPILKDYACAGEVIPGSQQEELAKGIFALAGGHGLCTGCDAGIIARNLISSAINVGEMSGKNFHVVVVGATGCLEVATTAQQTSYFPKRGPNKRYTGSYFHSAFDNVGASLSGIRAAFERKKKMGEIPEDSELLVIGIGGDGGTADIGIQALSGAWERGERILYVEYNNGAYMNTGIQGSSQTHPGAWTTTTPGGKPQPMKDVAGLLAAHDSTSSFHFVATGTTADLPDLQRKMRHGIEHSVATGPAFIEIRASCVPGHRIMPAQALDTNEMAIATASAVSYEIKDSLLKLHPGTPKPPEAGKDGKFAVTKETRKPITELLKMEGRFRGVRDDEAFIAALQWQIDERLRQLWGKSVVTENTDKILRQILDEMKRQGKFSFLFKPSPTPKEMEADPLYGDIQFEQRFLLGQMRRAIYDKLMETGFARKELEVSFENIVLAVLSAQNAIAELKIPPTDEKKAPVVPAAPVVEKKEPLPPLTTSEMSKKNRAIIGSREITGVWLGRGGGGGVSATEVLVKFLYALGFHVRQFPKFGPERQGAPVETFIGFSGKKILPVGEIYTKDLVVVHDLKAWEDPAPLENGQIGPKFLKGLKEDGILIVNTALSPEEFRSRFRIEGRTLFTVDMSKRGGEKSNFAMLGAVVAALKSLGLYYNPESLKPQIHKLIGSKLGADVAQKNIEFFLGALKETRGEKEKLEAKAAAAVGQEGADEPPQGLILSGNSAAVKMIEQVSAHFPVVFPGFPITPTTQIAEESSGLAEQGKLKFIRADSEHSAFSAGVAAAKMGAVVITASGSQGIVYAAEPILLAPGHRPEGFVAFVGNREINMPNLNIHRGHSDVMTTFLNSGWIQLHAATQQEVYDFGFIGLLASIIAKFPVTVNEDGFFVTHTLGHVETLTEEQVKELCEWAKNFKNNPTVLDDGKTFGGIDLQDVFMEHNLGKEEANRIRTLRALELVMEKFAELSGRRHSLFDTYKLEDATVALAVLGSTAGTAKFVVDRLREKGIKAGLISPKCHRPWNHEMLRDIVRNASHLRNIVAIDIFDAPGAELSPLAADLAIALSPPRRMGGRSIGILNRIMGLGGRDITQEQLIELLTMANLFEKAPSGYAIPPFINSDPELKTILKRLVEIEWQKLKRNAWELILEMEGVAPGTEEAKALEHAEKSKIETKLLDLLKFGDYLDFLGKKEYYGVREESNEMQWKHRFLKLLLARFHGVALDDLSAALEPPRAVGEAI